MSVICLGIELLKICQTIQKCCQGCAVWKGKEIKIPWEGVSTKSENLKGWRLSRTKKSVLQTDQLNSRSHPTIYISILCLLFISTRAFNNATTMWPKRLLQAEVIFQNIYLEGATAEISCWPQVAAFRGIVPQCCFKTPQATFEYKSCLKFPTSNLIVSAVNGHLCPCNSFAFFFMVMSCIQSSQKGLFKHCLLLKR